MSRQRDLWVTDTFEWRPEVRLAWAGECRIARRQLSVFLASWLWNQLTLPGKRYAVSQVLSGAGQGDVPNASSFNERKALKTGLPAESRRSPPQTGAARSRTRPARFRPSATTSYFYSTSRIA